MNLALTYDTETTGLPKWKEPSDSREQPHIVQLAAKLIDMDTWRCLEAISYVCRPSGWVIPPDTIEVHGISNFIANEIGEHEDDVLDRFMAMVHKADLIVAHNESFDQRIIRIGLKRFFPESVVGWKAKERFCTMRKSKEIVKAPPTPKMRAKNMKGYKNPNLGEAYKFFTGKVLNGAHDALVDVDACVEVFKCLQRDYKEAI